VGDHLSVDREFGFNVTRREGNPQPINRQAPSSLGGITTSGHMDYPRLVWWWPRAAPSQGATGPDHTNNSKLMAAGSLIIPSGRALTFDIIPRQTFLNTTSTEVAFTGAGTVTSLPFVMPSGGNRYPNGNGEWYDPGRHTVAQRLDIHGVSDLGSFIIQDKPLVALNEDITVLQLSLVAETIILNEANEVVGKPYWHSCDVKMWESSSPFVASGINTTDNNTIGFNTKSGMAFFPGDRTGV
jgi:hypothetical protein